MKISKIINDAKQKFNNVQQSVDTIADRLYKIEWEKKTQKEIEDNRSDFALFKCSPPGWIAKNYLIDIFKKTLDRKKLSKDALATRLIKHYFDNNGATYYLNIQEMRAMSQNSIDPVTGPVDIRKNKWMDYTENMRWRDARKKLKDTGESQVYAGSVLWVYANGAILNYWIHYAGHIWLNYEGGIEWHGRVIFDDRFDFNPNWGWSETKKNGGRSNIGERRTRIAYMLNLGNDFDIKSATVEAFRPAYPRGLRFGGMQSSNSLVPPPILPYRSANIMSR